MRIVGLDLSLTATGIARHDHFFHPNIEVATLKSRATGCARLVEIRDRIRALTAAPAPTEAVTSTTVVVIEGYGFGVPRGRSNAHSLGELGGVVRVALHELGVRYVDVPPASLKKYSTGKGNAPKDQVLVAAVKRSGIEFEDNNQADAWWLCQIGLAHYQPDHPDLVPMPQANRDALDKVEWPAIPERSTT